MDNEIIEPNGSMHVYSHGRFYSFLALLGILLIIGATLVTTSLLFGMEGERSHQHINTIQNAKKAVPYPACAGEDTAFWRFVFFL